MSAAVETRLLEPGDRSLLDHVAPDVFDRDIDPGWGAEFLNGPRHHLVVALSDDQIVGFAPAVHDGSERTGCAGAFRTFESPLT
jgi:hypothetical protein